MLITILHYHALGAQTAIGVALKKARDELNNHSSAARKKKVWLLTDGNNNVPTVDPVTEADALKAMGGMVYFSIYLIK